LDTQRWTAALARVTGHEAADIDDITGAFDVHRGAPGRDIFPELDGAPMPETLMKRPGAVCVGVRIAAPPADAADRALHLIAFALEKDVEVVVLSDVDTTGFERFGFRVERISGDTPEARSACERQICRFWNIDMVI
jgi:hypothetical protein